MPVIFSLNNKSYLFLSLLKTAFQCRSEQLNQVLQFLAVSEFSVVLEMTSGPKLIDKNSVLLQLVLLSILRIAKNAQSSLALVLLSNSIS